MLLFTVLVYKFLFTLWLCSLGRHNCQCRAAAISGMEKYLFNLKMAAKQMERAAKKCEKEEKAERTKLKKAIQQGNIKGAWIYAENSIRNKNQALNFLRISARVDAVSMRVQTAIQMKQVTSSMAEVVESLDSAFKSMNIEKVTQIMDTFEKQMEYIDVQTDCMEGTMPSSTTLNMLQADVIRLMAQVADEHGLELNMKLPASQIASIGNSKATAEQDKLSSRLAALRNM